MLNPRIRPSCRRRSWYQSPAALFVDGSAGSPGCPYRKPKPSTLRACFCGWSPPGAQVNHSNIKPRKVVSLRHHRRPVSDFNAQIVNCPASVNLYQDHSSPDPPTHGFGEPISRRVSALQFSNSSHAWYLETAANQHIKFYKRVKWT